MNKNNDIKIAIIGAGLAGLAAAYRLSQKGITAEVFEARNRVGGLVFTAWVKNYLGDFSLVELGGQYLTDGGEATNIVHLADELGLTIDTNEIDLASLIYYQNNYIDFQERLTHFLQNIPDVNKAVNLLTPHCASMEELIHRFFVNDTVLQSAFKVRMTAYEGVDTKQQSLHHNLDTFLCSLQGGIAESHEHYQHKPNHIIIKYIREGNAMLAIKMAEVLGSQLHLNKALVKIEKVDGQFNLVFNDHSTALYDSVILAIPASTYEQLHIAENIQVRERWKTMQSVAYGENYKIFCPFKLDKEITHTSIISDNQLSFFTPDKNVVILYANRHINPTEMQKQFDIVRDGYQLTNSLEAKIIAIAEDKNYCSYTQPLTHDWFEDPYAKGSYSGYSTTLSTALDEKVSFKGEEFKTLFKPTPDGLYFIGEHTTLLDYVGTMEAAIESGERVARLFTATHQ